MASQLYKVRSALHWAHSTQALSEDRAPVAVDGDVV